MPTRPEYHRLSIPKTKDVDPFYATLKWSRLRKTRLRLNPICQICGIKAARHVDHIIPRRRGGPDTLTNLQSLCVSCHGRKTAIHDGGFTRG